MEQNVRVGKFGKIWKFLKLKILVQGICQLSESGVARLQIKLKVGGARTKNSWQVLVILVKFSKSGGQ